MGDKLRMAIKCAIEESHREEGRCGRSRRLSLARTKLEEAFLWWVGCLPDEDRNEGEEAG
jgi:hypothetical protein